MRGQGTVGWLWDLPTLFQDPKAAWGAGKRTAWPLSSEALAWVFLRSSRPAPFKGTLPPASDAKHLLGSQGKSRWFQLTEQEHIPHWIQTSAFSGGLGRSRRKIRCMARAGLPVHMVNGDPDTGRPLLTAPGAKQPPRGWRRQAGSSCSRARGVWRGALASRQGAQRGSKGPGVSHQSYGVEGPGSSVCPVTWHLRALPGQLCDASHQTACIKSGVCSSLKWRRPEALDRRSHILEGSVLGHRCP
ncbi:uncharacterized protein LOC129136006 [Pan troglodytes]|nr:uncharacterized protein LOC129136006 [Pan troglodytes]